MEAALRDRIEAGEWASDEALPTVAELAAEYHVSNTSVTRALHTLEKAGLVRIVPRWGTFRV